MAGFRLVEGPGGWIPGLSASGGSHSRWFSNGRRASRSDSRAECERWVTLRLVSRPVKVPGGQVPGLGASGGSHPSQFPGLQRRRETRILPSVRAVARA